ncbi:MAG TPA: thioredoxin domain-containing protein [Blastocatellia bacterium]|nr:thioredoxin domain-containing protein [Blastocatellia bacterium]
MKRVLTLFMIVAFVCACTVYAQIPAPQTQPQPSAPQKKDEDCGCEVKIPEGRAAIVNGVKVSVDEIDEPIKNKIKELQDQIVETRKNEVDLLINARLLDIEAKKRGITAEKILQTDVESKVIEPTEAEAQRFYQQNQTQLQGDYNDLKPSILAYLRAERMRIQAKRLADQLRATAQVKILGAATPPQSEADRARVLATLNGEPITVGDVETALAPIIFTVQEQIYELRKAALEARINDILLDQEAKKRNSTAQDLYRQEVSAKVKQPTDADAEKFFDENKANLKAGYEELKVQIIQYLQSKAYEKAENDFAATLRKTATVESYIRPPESPLIKIAIDDQPMKGNPEATVTIVEFTDFQCPTCGRTAPILDDLMKEYGSRVRLVVRDFPLDMHPNAEKAAEAAEAAREQGKYWEYIAILFKNQEALQVPKLKEYATQVGLDRARFDQALDSGKFYEKVARDLREGEKLGVGGTPTIFINGRRIRERTPEALKAAIEAALKSTASK